ncbi:MAG: L-arabinose isomerase [Oscillospiraceae bacterium]|jgi:L-arabinose isomerase|nr:L-arabinose isomerase [Oscillospiraceae bacterium]
MSTKKYQFWFLVGSQDLYGEETLNQVERNSHIIADDLNKSGVLPWEVAYKDTLKTANGVTALIKAANFDDNCAGVITFCHTFSPSKMWINGLSLLQKPWLQFHTQFNEEIPNEAIDMDYMNLHQSAHGDREHGYIGARMGLRRKVVAGYRFDVGTLERIAKWMRASVGAAFSRNLKVMRFGDNMREVAVTEGDKVESQIKLGWQVNTWSVGQLVEYMDSVTDSEIAAKLAEYRRKYTFSEPDTETIRYQAIEEIAIRKMLDEQDCSAFTNTFENLYGMRQLPGLATQNLMSQGFGYGGEGDWKVSALTAVMKAMTKDKPGGTSFMEDYTYDMKNGISLGAHMLEVCPSIADSKPNIEVHPLGIGGREPPARLVFEGKARAAIVASLIDMGTHLRLIVQDIECVKPTQTMPNLPVARVMWKPRPNLAIGAECWILAGGAHHTVLSYDCDAEIMRDWARIFDIEFVHITDNSDPVTLEKELQVSQLLRILNR